MEPMIEIRNLEKSFCGEILFQDISLDIRRGEIVGFNVGITRAKKQVYVSASSKRLDNYENEKASIFSCMVGINGVKLVKAD